VAGRLRAWGVPGERIEVIPNGIDAAEFRFDPALRAETRARFGIAPDALVIGGVGRLEPTKRFERLIAAVRKIPAATLLLAGDGSAREVLEEKVHAAGIADRVVFAGAVAHSRAALCAMDVFASPSDQETFGLVVLEALACGLPAVYGVCPPLDERAAASGVLDRGTAPGARRLSTLDWESLSRTLRAELAAFELRGRQRLPVPQVVAHFDTGRLATSVSDLYQRVAGRPARRRRSIRHLESEGTRR
jgi:glycosyltransferase involved in cell wall biosynthesis